MKIQIKEVQSKKDLRDFVYLPGKINKDLKNWVPPIYSDDMTFFNPKTNESFSSCDYKLLLAYKGEELVGRCMGLIHDKYNQDHNEKCGRFSFLESINDQEVFHAMIDYVAQWAKSMGMEQLVGPLAFSDHDPQGFLVEGYNEVHVIASTCNYPYINELCEKEGLTKKVDLWSFNVIIPDKYPPIYERIAERYSRSNANIRIAEYKSRIQFRPIIKPVLQLINDTFGDIYGFTPFSEKEMNDYANRYIFLLSPAFIKVAYNEKNEVIGNIIGMPDISEGVKKCNGRILPFGIFRILWAGRKSKRVVLLLGSVRSDYQGRGVEALMGIKIMESAKKQNKNLIDTHLGLETNTKRSAEMERMGGKVYKKHRIYQMDL